MQLNLDLKSKDIDNIQKVSDLALDLDGKYPGMTYEAGVRAALEWVLGYNDTHPLED